MQKQPRLEVELTGFQRFKLVRLWHKTGKPGDKEEFVKKACKQKGILYTKPVKVTRDMHKIKASR